MGSSSNGRREALILAGVAAGAGLAGVGWKVWRDLATPAPPAGPPWDQRFLKLDGSALDLASLHGRPLVLNFWATWCPPCVKELPELDRFHRQWSPRDWQVVGLAVDGARAVREFLRQQPLSFPIGLAGLEGTTLSRNLGNAQGALPFTVVFDGRGRLIHRKLGATDFEELSAWARGL
ncbi:MAG: TlpA disulfide reductase family protein [Rubrivivax sp.]